MLKRPPQERWVSVVAEGSQVANLVELLNGGSVPVLLWPYEGA